MKKQLSLSNIYAMEEVFDEVENKKELEEAFLEEFDNIEEALPAAETTIAHDINFYSGTANPLKKGEKESHAGRFLDQLFNWRPPRRPYRLKTQRPHGFCRLPLRPVKRLFV